MSHFRLIASLLAVIALALTGVTAVGVLPASAGTVSTVIGNITYTADNTAVSSGAKVTSYSGSGGAVVIAGVVTIAGTQYSVTSVGDSAFNNKQLTSVTIPSSVTTIGLGAFAVNSLTAITIPDGVVTIGEQAFIYNHIGSVTIPASVQTIGSGAFSYSGGTVNTVLFLGKPPTITSQGGAGSFGGAVGRTLYYLPAYASFFPNPWQGYTTAEAQFFTTATLTIGGSVKVGQTLTVNGLTSWSPAPTIATYSWTKSNGTVFLGSDDHYVPTVADLYSRIMVTVTAASAGYLPTTISSAETTPVQLPTPTISGMNLVGQTLIANTGTWPTGTTFAYAWRHGGSEIVLGTADRYILVSTDLGETLNVTVTATLAGFSDAVVTSEPSLAVASNVFAITTVPTISGVAKVGQTLTAYVSRWWSWSPTPTNLTYAWTRSSSEGVLGTDETYVPTDTDLGAKLTVTVTAERAGYVPAVVSAETAAVSPGTFTTTPTPTISGTSQVGQTLTANPGTWPENTTLTYAWRQVGSETILHSAATYTPASTDQGKYLTVTVTASLTGYSNASVTSSPSAVVAAGAFGNPPTPTITGTAQVGQQLQVSTGEWATGATLTYSWKRSGSTTVIGTAVSYTAVAADMGKILTATVTATRPGFTTATTPGAVTAAVLGLAFTSTPVPTITGTKTSGSTVTAVTGTWAPATGVTFTYVWKRASTSTGTKTTISGATSKTYKLVTADKGKYITVTVIASKAGYVSATTVSADGGTRVAS